MKKPNYAMKYILAVLLLATLTTTQILSVVYAKYTITSGPVGDFARVAVYEVTATGVDGNSNMPNAPASDQSSVNLDAAGSQTISGTAAHSISKQYQIVNKSEVAVSYNVVVTLDKELPAGTSVTMTDANDSTIHADTTNDDDRATVTFTSNAWVLAPNAGEEGTHTITLTFTTNTNGSAVSDLSGIPVTVEVNAAQID